MEDVCIGCKCAVAAVVVVGGGSAATQKGGARRRFVGLLGGLGLYRIVVTVIVAAGVVVITDDAAVVLLTLLLSKTVRILLQYPCRHPRTSMFVLILVVQANACRYLDSKSAAVAAAGVLLPLLLSVTV